MILFVREADQVKEFCASSEGCHFSVLNQDAFIYENEGRWKLSLPESLKPDPAFRPPDQDILRITDEGEHTAYLILLDGEENWKDYECCRMPSAAFTVGSGDTDTIVYLNDFVEPACLRIDPETRTIDSDDILFINGMAVTTPYIYQYGDMIGLYGLRMIMMESCLLINRMSGLYTNLEPFSDNAKSQPASGQEPLRYERIPFVMPADTYEVKLEPPGHVSQQNRGSLLLSIGPSVMMGCASLASGLLSFYNGYEKGRELHEMIPSLLFPVMMLISALLWSPLQRLSEKRRRKREITDRDNDYCAYLDKQAEAVRQFRDQYVSVINSVFPSSASLRQVCTAGNVVKIPDCPEVFVRLGTSENAVRISIAEKEGLGKEESTQIHTETFRQMVLEPVQVPYILDLSAYKRITCENAPEEVIDDLLMQICLRTHPDETGIILLCRKDFASERRWLSNLPHLYSQGSRLIAFNEDEAEEIAAAAAGMQKRMIVINLLNPWFLKGEFCSQLCFTGHSDLKCDMRISFDEERCLVSDFLKSRNISFSPDLSAECLSSVSDRLPHPKTSTYSDRSFSFLEMYGCSSVDDLKIEERWQTSNINKGVRALIGCGSDGEDIILDLYEKRDGPHGLIAGTTGSGKSELILTMILSLAVSYPPEDLQLILIDFKGGSSLNSLCEGNTVLPHVTGRLSNLDDEDIQRAKVQFSTECMKRAKLFQELRSKCNEPVMDISEYRRLWKPEYGLEWMCELVIIVDEFAQLKSEQPAFLDELIKVARTGRSLGIHLILATQKPAGVVTDQIWSNTKFKICLKVAETQDSVEMIKKKDAAYIREPGVFILLTNERDECGRSGYVQYKSAIIDKSVVVYDLAGKIVRDSSALYPETEAEIKRVLKKILEIQEKRPPVRQLWMPPLNKVSRDDLRENWAFAIVDDYHQNRYTDLVLYNDAVHAFLSGDLHEKRNLTRVLADTILRNCGNDDELVIIDDLKAVENRQLLENPVIADIFSSQDEEACISLFHNLSRRTENDSRMFLIINDLAAFYELNPDAHELLMKAAARCQEKKLTLITIASSAGSYGYRDASVLTYRYVLDGTSLQDITGFFETNEKPSLLRPYHGLALDKPLKEFCLYECSAEDLAAAACSSDKPARTRSKSVFLHMPPRICLDDCTAAGIPLGIVKKNCRWLAIRKEKVCIAAADSDRLSEIEELYKERGYTGGHTFPAEEQLTFVMCDQLRDFDSVKYQDTVFLFLYDAFSMQYRITRRISRKPNESILFYRNRTEVIRTAEE